ncbi:unnamed protein product [Sphagnum troendelagicum]|uniref:Uncharacterized protein n=1 Tax=Sphagnum troendelagicum TaxID=128251 RepID=A0ABP0U3X7_9BRYO
MCATAMITPKSTKADHKEKCLRTPGCCFLRSPAQHRKEEGPCPGPCRRSFRGAVLDPYSGPCRGPRRRLWGRGASVTPREGRVQDLVDGRSGPGEGRGVGDH